MKLFNLADYIYEHKEFSQNTFGPGDRQEGIIQHIRKELLEVQDAEGKYEKFEEWTDVIILAIDAIWRLGIPITEVEDMLVYKQMKNKMREWPDWRQMRQDQPIEHVKATGEMLSHQTEESGPETQMLSPEQVEGLSRGHA